jgi:aminomethyltransferase
MGEFLLTGPNALALIQKVTSNDASTLTIGRALFCLPNSDGGIVDATYKMKEAVFISRKCVEY